jgi:hypothetical protein
MKTQSKPIRVLASGAILLLGAVCQTVHAQGTLIDSNTVSVASSENVAAYNLSVQTEVFYNSSSATPYTYDYTVYNPSTDIVGGFGQYVGSFQVGFNGAAPNAAVNFQPAGDDGQNEGSIGASWQLDVGPSQNSGTLSFQSIYSPNTHTANASGDDTWATLPNGQYVYAPNAFVVPEPGTTSLMVMTLLGMAFQSIKTAKIKSEKN